MKRLSLFGAALLLSACATRTARLYDLDQPRILQASYRTTVSGHGPMSITDTAGMACVGEYVTVPQGTTGWGAIYGSMGAAQAVTGTSSTDQRGQAVANCPDGTVIQCEYVTSAATGAGGGACQDNRSHHYRLMF